jgi:hypothetical protein
VSLFAELSGVESGSNRLLFFYPESALGMRSGYTDDITSHRGARCEGKGEMGGNGNWSLQDRGKGGMVIWAEKNCLYLSEI